MDKHVKWGIIAGIIVVSCSVFYYLVIFLPHAEAVKAAQQQIGQNLERQKEADAIAAKQEEQYAALKANYRAECIATEKENLKSMNAMASACQGDLQAVRACVQSISDSVGSSVGESFIVACTNNKLKESGIIPPPTNELTPDQFNALMQENRVSGN